MTVCKVSCMFQSCTSSPSNARSREVQAPAEPEMRIVVKRKLTVGGLIGNLASVTHYHWCNNNANRDRSPGRVWCVCVFPTCNFFLEYDPRFSVAPFQMKPDWNKFQPSNLHFPNITIQRCAQFPNNSQTIAVGTKSFPAPVSNVSCSNVVPLDLCYANQDLH